MKQSPAHSWPNHTESVDSLQTEQIRLLYANLPMSIVINASLALILVGIQSQVISTSRLVVWLSVFALVLLGRILLAIALRRSRDEVLEKSRHWIFWLRLGVIATGIVWGVGAILLSPPENLVHQVYVAFLLAGLCAGAITSLFIDRISVFGFVLPILLPHMTFFILQGDAVHISMSGMMLLFLLYIAASARRAGLTLHENFRLRTKTVEDELRLREILEYSPVATRITDRTTHKVIFANQSYISLLGATTDQVIGIDPTQCYANPEDYADILERLDKGEHITNTLVELNVGEEMQTSKWALASYIQIEYQSEPAILGWLYDITDRKQMEEEIQHIAYHDSLTGLPNRILLDDRLHQALTIAERDNISVALMFIDLDKFKPVNDTHGHEVGDLMLQAVAERISNCLRKSDSVARIGGDEFVVLLPEVENAEAALEVAEKIHSSLNQTFQLANLTLNISSSTGIAIYPEHAIGEKQLIHYADTAMYYAKKNGRDNVQLYKAGMREIIDEVCASS